MKKVLLTGCNTGIGLGLLEELLNQNYEVIACVRKPDYFSLLHTRCGDQNSKRLHPYAFELGSEIESSLERIREDHGCPDVIINNAGILLREGESTRETFQRLEESLKINVLAPMLICDVFKEEMKAKPWGRIINMSSKMASLDDNRSGGSLPYRASKGVLNHYTVNLAVEMNDTNIKVFCVHPGWIRTKMGGEFAPDDVSAAVQRVLFTLEDDAEKFHGKFLVGNEVLPW